MNELNRQAAEVVTQQPAKLKSENGWVRNLIGKRFGRLIVVEFAGRKPPYTYWRVVCDCGKGKVIGAVQLVTGATKSCGCIKLEQTEAMNWRHGCARMTDRIPEYNVWVRIKTRCSNPNSPFYYRYGGRGISMCEGFGRVQDFINLVGRRPTAKHSIDRINNDGHYSCGKCEQCVRNEWPMNVRWATWNEQASNRSTSHRITFNGETLSATEWAKRSGLKQGTVLSRLKQGWDEIEAITMSLEDAEQRRAKRSGSNRSSNRWIEFNGERRTLADWARKIGISAATLDYRIEHWDLLRAMSSANVNGETRFGGKRDPRIIKP